MFFLKELPTRQMLEGYHTRFPKMNVSALEEALIMMRRASLLVRRLERYFDVHGLSLLRFLILIVIDREPERDGLSIGEITERVDVSKPVMTRTLKSLEQDGLISITSQGEDKRVKCVCLTPKGAAMLNDVLPGYFSLIDEFMTPSPE
jgi:DNA-binding MarR family transcriptional regulator